MQKYKIYPKKPCTHLFFCSKILLNLLFQIKSSNFAIMIELDKHIEILLLKSDCVIVPGLGGFVASHVPARYDENDSMFIPPLRTLGFNPKLNINDSLLVQSYTDTYDISYPEAFNRIENEVNELKQHLENNGSYELNNIGTLFLNDEFNIEFTPCEAGILTPNLYSLSSFEIKRRMQTSSNEENKKTKAAIIPFSEHSLAGNNAQQVHTHKPQTGSDRIQIRISALRNFAAAVIAVILFLALGTPVNNSSTSIRTSGIDNGIINKLITDSYNNIKKENIPLTNKKTTESKDSARKKTVNAECIEKVQAENKDGDYYCIVLASQVTKKNAATFVDKLQKQGYANASVLIEKRKSTKVVYGHYMTQSDAYNELNSLKHNESFKEAWVYQVRN